MKTKDIVTSVFSIAIKVIVLIVAAMFIYRYATAAYDYGYRVFGEKPMTEGEGRTVSVTIGSGMGTKEIGELLENKGLIRDAKLFVIQEKLSENAGKISPGIYDLNTSMTAEEMIAIMAGEGLELSTEDSNPIEDAKTEAESENTMNDVTNQEAGEDSGETAQE